MRTTPRDGSLSDLDFTKGLAAVFGPTLALTSQEISARFSDGPDFLEPLRDALVRFASPGGVRELKGDAILIGPRPDIGALAYDVVLYPAISPESLAAYERLTDFAIPPTLVSMLSVLNGCYFFGLNVYGVPLSMTQDPPLHDRSSRAPLELGAGRWWRVNYSGYPEDATLFASRNVSDEGGQVGFFLTPLGGVVGVGNGRAGAQKDYGSWPSFSTWWNWAAQLAS